MKRISLVRIHVAATVVALLTIVAFFVSSVVVEVKGEILLIRAVKSGILYGLPLLLLAMPTVALTGKRLAGTSTHPAVLQKQKRMKIIVANGVILITLAVFLYYQAHYRAIDTAFLCVQSAEFAFGLCNMVLIGLNIKSGFALSGRLKKKRQ